MEKERITATRRPRFAETLQDISRVIVNKVTPGRTSSLVNVWNYYRNALRDLFNGDGGGVDDDYYDGGGGGVDYDYYEHHHHRHHHHH